MSSQRQKRKEEREVNSDPINFTCGECHQVHAFDPEHPLECEVRLKEVEDGSGD